MASTSRLTWLSQLNPIPDAHLRRTAIIGTIGPKTNNPETLVALRKAGLNIVRMNFSHGSYEYHQSVVNNARKSEELYPGRPLAIALDTKGPEIRTGTTKNDVDYPIPTNHEMTFTTDDKYKLSSDDSIMYLDYKNITGVISKGKHIYVDDGVLAFEVLEVVDNQTLRVKSLNAGKICSHKGVNLPGTDVDLPALSEKDISDLKFGVKNGVHMVFASFIRTANDVKTIREVLGEEGKDIKIVVKIENQQGVNNFDDILAVTDAVMVARGDLGIEIPAPEVLAVQKKLIAKSNLAGKPVICATQMLESMTYNPRPTRAEVSDVGNAILDGADCVMLSGETAKGNYPLNAVTTMADTARIAEQAIAYQSHYDDLRDSTPKPTSTVETVAAAAVAAAFEQDAKAIIVLSTSGTTPRLLSKYRPSCPIVEVTRNPRTARFSHLFRGVFPFVYEKPQEKDWTADVEARLNFGIAEAKKFGFLKEGDAIVTIQGLKPGVGHSNTLRVSIV
ncbi:Pyruvate kinase [Zygosaccharomyces bailii]|uniref:Pyruvate kinase n=1 Tax=Zygosaccharomyces bailii (strain CLIB 213 / ATCC 58445 / CBS 680 / BCRC 21525 / NBRC 1098 / NCYC 1416 / NRRL Y-2227) TaxID=1333698 RepID=A0A8J2T9C4_ZYGB2|nr:ZYBA0S07-05072g1_1 [Zygosaccharomyces bailii CLIB 213]CDH13146.1 Pyruvate kinase [Zygosaccharomyces bailii ISA1307]SJM84257.1 Pyruvate kinase [Zygosaccharomyces bailii]